MALLTIEIRDDPQTESCDWTWLNYLLPIKEFIVVSIKVGFILRFFIAAKEITAPVIPVQKILPFIFTLIILFNVCIISYSCQWFLAFLIGHWSGLIFGFDQSRNLNV